MRRGRFILGAVLVSAFVVVAFQAYLLSSLTSSLASSPSFSPSNNYANSTNSTLTLTGPVTTAAVSPMCAIYANPGCAAWIGTVYYITIDGVNYRLIFPASVKPPTNGLQITVTGTFVTPSTYQSYQYTPQLSFRGDIYVISYSYAPSA
jgi:hypothetical protein